MTNIFRKIGNFFNPSFEDMLFAHFKTEREGKPLEVKPVTPLMPPFRSKEIDVYINRDKNFVFVEAFGENSCFLRYLIYSLSLAYSQPSQENMFKNNFYIFTDNPELIECPPLFFILPTKKKDLYQKISELKEQIMPEPEKPKLYPVYDPEQDIYPVIKPPRASRLKNFPEFANRIMELFR